MDETGSLLTCRLTFLPTPTFSQKTNLEEYRNCTDECVLLRAAAEADKQAVVMWQSEAVRLHDKVQLFIADTGAPHTSSETIATLEAEAKTRCLELERLRQQMADSNRSISTLVVRFGPTASLAITDARGHFPPHIRAHPHVAGGRASG